MKRPYKVKFGTFVGLVAVVLSSAMTLLYVIPLPFASTAPVTEEWIMTGGWTILGIVFYGYCKFKYGDAFGAHMDVEYEDIAETEIFSGRVESIVE